MSLDLAHSAERVGPSRLFRAPDFRWVDVDGVGWWVRTELGEELIGPSGLRLEEWRGEGRLREVKRSPQRIVYRADLPKGTFYIKHFLVPGWRETLRQWLRRGKGRNEGQRAAQLEAIGVPTIRPVALGEHRRSHFLFDNYLISREIPDALPLDHFVEEGLTRIAAPGRAVLRRELSVALGRLTARLHRAGIIHADYHAGNLLVRIDADGRPELAMIDLDALRSYRSLSARRRLGNLAHLNHAFWLRTSRHERLRFLRAYLREMGETNRERDWARAIDRRTRRWAERLWRRWGRRCTATNKYFVVDRAEGAWAVSARSIGRSTVSRLMADPDAPFTTGAATILKDSKTTTVAEWICEVDGRPTNLVYKRFNKKKRWERFWTLFRPSRGWRSWRAGHHLESRGLPTPSNLLIIGAKALAGGVGPAECHYLATLKLDPARTVGEVFRSDLVVLKSDERTRVARRLSTALARLVRDLHDRSISDRDLKVSNVMVVGDPADDPPQLKVIDLAGVRPIHPLPYGRRLQNVSRMIVSLEALPGWNRAASLRFLRDYLRGEARRPDVVRRWWRDLQRLARRKRARNGRNGRALS